jgi:hypothetical protein
MRITFLFLFVITIGIAQNPNVAIVYDLASVLENKLITLQVTGNENSTHYTKPILAKITNTSQYPLRFFIANGQIFRAEDSTVQDIVIVKEELIALKANETKELPLYGMCIELSNSGNNSETLFYTDGIADEKLLKLTQEIEKSKNFNTLGQYAVWTLTDEYGLNSISGFDMEEASRLKTFVAGILDVPVPKYDPNDYTTNYYNDGLIKRAAKSRFKFTFSEDSAVTIAMFDENNIIVRELYNNSNVKAGYHELEFKFDVEVYQNQAYYIRMIVDGEIEIDMKMEPRRS